MYYKFFSVKLCFLLLKINLYQRYNYIVAYTQKKNVHQMGSNPTENSNKKIYRILYIGQEIKHLIL